MFLFDYVSTKTLGSSFAIREELYAAMAAFGQCITIGKGWRQASLTRL